MAFRQEGLDQVGRLVWHVGDRRVHGGWPQQPTRRGDQGAGLAGRQELACRARRARGTPAVTRLTPDRLRAGEMTAMTRDGLAEVVLATVRGVVEELHPGVAVH